MHGALRTVSKKQPEVRAMKCSDAMTANPACCLPDDTVGQAARMMRREHAGWLPVISDEWSRKLIGILTSRDLAMKVVGEARDINRTPVSDVMTKIIVACRADDDLISAARAMDEHEVRRIPVLDRDNRLVGIVSQLDGPPVLDRSFTLWRAA
jgi:CBS domain-containing protein